MTTETHPSVFLIDLDSLFDTRLGTLVLHFHEELEYLFDKNLYHNRLDNSFNKIVDKDKFTEAYGKRNKFTLANSTLTLMCDILKDFIYTTHIADHSNPHKYHPVIYINTYPYELNSTEINNILLGLYGRLGDKVVIEIVHMDNKALSVDFVRKNITAMALYEYNKWMDAQTELGNFNKEACPEVTLFGPRIFFKKLPDTQKESDKTFNTLLSISKPFINLELLPSLFFSTFLRPASEKETQQQNTSGT